MRKRSKPNGWKKARDKALAESSPSRAILTPLGRQNQREFYAAWYERLNGLLKAEVERR